MSAEMTPPFAGPTLPGWVLRFSLAVASLAAVATVVIGVVSVGSALGLAAVAVALGAALYPGTVMPLVLICGVVVFRIATPGAGWDGRLIALVALLPLIHQLAGLAAVIPIRSRCDLRLFRPAALRYLVATAPVVTVAAIMAA